MYSSLENDVTLITGGAKRVGAAIYRLLHTEGARLMIHYRSSDEEARTLQSKLNLKRPNSVAIIQGVLLKLSVLPKLVRKPCSTSDAWSPHQHHRHARRAPEKGYMDISFTTSPRRAW